MKIRATAETRLSRFAPVSRRLFVNVIRLLVLGAAAPPTIIIGNHAKYGRVVINLPRGIHETITRHNDQLVLALPGAGMVPGLAHGPRNVTSAQGGADQLTLVLAPGAEPKIVHGTHQLVVDVYAADTAGAVPAPRAASLPLEIQLVPIVPPKPPAAPTASAPPPNASPALPAAPAPPEPVASDALVAQRLPPDPAAPQPQILVPFGRDVGAAAFGRSGTAYVLFDAAKPIDLAALKDDAVFASARVTLLPAATQLAMKVPPGARVALHRRPEGWAVGVVTMGAAPDGAALAMQNGTLTISTHAAADTLVLVDAATGGRLLVGTVSGEDAGVSVPHASPEFAIQPSWAGVLLVAQSDRLVLRAGKSGFTLATTTAPPLAAVAGSSAERALGNAADLTRHFDLTPQPVPLLLKNLRAALGAAAASPRLARLAPRVRAAQAMIALGMDREAEGVLAVGLRDDSSPAAQADARALLALAHCLSGDAQDPDSRAADAQAIANPALGQSDEVALWRAMLQSGVPSQAQSAATLSATWRLLLGYPEPLRHRLAPMVAQALLAGGQPAAAQTLADHLPDKALDGTRAALLQKAGHVAEALALLDRMATGRDRLLAANAAREATEMRLAQHSITPAQAAEALDRQLYDWRDDETEITQRLRIAGLRAEAGAWRHALTGLRGTAAEYPAAQDRVHTAQLAVITGLLHGGKAQRLPAMDLVALVAENADLLGSQEASVTLAPVLADKLVALDLPNRAAPILAKLMQATDAAEPRAALGARVASLRLDLGDTQAALKALDTSAAPDLPASLQTTRAVLRARALADSGQDGAALAVLSALAGAASQDALEMQTHLLEKRNDWHGAITALQSLVRVSMPPGGVLTDVQQDLVLHLASDAARAGDMAVLQQLQDGDAKRLTTGGRAALFQALSQQPIRALADLPRSAREAESERAVPAALASYHAP
jgi:hypothetical protein